MSSPENGSFRFLGERVRYDGFFFRLTTGTFLDPHGYTFERDIIRHLGAVCVVAIEGDPPAVIMVRQYRAAVDQEILEVPAGKLDVPNEKLDAAAARELAEEVGREAGRMTLLGSFYNSPGFSNERTTCFLAEELRSVDRDTQGVEEEHMSIVPVPLHGFWRLVDNGEIIDSKTIISVTLAERVLAGRRVG